MGRQLHSLSLMAVFMAAGGWAAGLPAEQPLPQGVGIGAAALSDPATRSEAAEAVDSATAAALIGAIATHFGEQDVGVRLDRVAMEPASIRDRTVTGEGRVRIGEGDEWIPFRFHALYDTQTTEVVSPILELGPDRTDFEPVPAGSDVARALDTRVAEALGAEFPSQPVRWNADQVRVAPLAGSLVKVQASGTADFDAEGLTKARVEALYDQESGRWLSIDYELGAGANQVEDATGPEAVATR